MKATFTLKEIAEKINGRVIGNENYQITGAADFEAAGENDISFAENQYILKKAIKLNCCALITNEQIQTDKNLIVVDYPKLGFALCVELFYNEPQPQPGISSNSHVDNTAKIGKNVYIGPFAVIERKVTIMDNAKIYPNVFIGENSIIGTNTKIYPGVNIYYNTEIGNDCIIHAGAVIGGDGFGFLPVNNKMKKLYQIGNVIIKGNVEIGSNATIDRATTGSTIIEENVKLDSQVHVGHNCLIGENTVMAAQCGMSGSSKVGKNVMFGGQCAVAPHTSVSDNVMVGGKSAVTSSNKPGSIISGFPARPHKEEKKIKASLSKLPGAIKKIRSLFDSVKRISHRLENIEKFLNLKWRQDK